MKKRFKEILIPLIISAILLVSLTGCSNKNGDDAQELKNKVDSEMLFLDTQLLDMLNKLNGILFVNYVVSAQEVKENESTSSNSKEENSSEGNSSSDGASKDNSQSGSNSGNSSSKSKTTTAVDYSMESNGILSSKNSTDWNSLKYDIEQLYTSWATIILDLYKLNINSNDILGFSSDLDLATKAIKDENKKDSLLLLAKLYSYIPKYVESYSNNTRKINVLKTKSSILNAYSIIEENRKEDVKKEIANAEQAYLPIINDIGSDSNKQFNINKAYILIKEMQNSIDTDTTEIFYIKYKNLMEELAIIQ